MTAPRFSVTVTESFEIIIDTPESTVTVPFDDATLLIEFLEMRVPGILEFRIGAGSGNKPILRLVKE
jgi:hypothetical protein